MRNIREYIEPRMDIPRDGYIVETPYINSAKASQYEMTGVQLIHNGNRTKFYADERSLCKLIDRLIKNNIFIASSLYNKNDDRVCIYPVSSNINDSVKENKGFIFENSLQNTPLMYRRRAILDLVHKGEIERNPESIRAAFEESGRWTSEWENCPENKKINHINYVMKRTEGIEPDEKPFNFNDDNIDMEGNDLVGDIQLDDENDVKIDNLEKQVRNAELKTIVISEIFAREDKYDTRTEATAFMDRYNKLIDPSNENDKKYAKYITFKVKPMHVKECLVFITFPDVKAIKYYIENVLLTQFFGWEHINNGGKRILEITDYLDNEGVLYPGEFEEIPYANAHKYQLLDIAIDHKYFIEGGSRKYKPYQLAETGEFMTLDEYVEYEYDLRRRKAEVAGTVAPDSNFEGFADDN